MELAPEIRLRRKEIRVIAKVLLSMTFRHRHFPFDVKISNAGIKEWLNQPHIHYADKNEALLDFPELFASSEYIGAMLDSKLRPDVRYSHVFKTDITGCESWIIVHEMIWGEFWLHSISDNLAPYTENK